MQTNRRSHSRPHLARRGEDGGGRGGAVETYGHGSNEDEEAGASARYMYIFIRSIPCQLPVHPSLSTHTHTRARARPSIRQLSSIEAVRHRKVVASRRRPGR